MNIAKGKKKHSKGKLEKSGLRNWPRGMITLSYSHRSFVREGSIGLPRLQDSTLSVVAFHFQGSCPPRGYEPSLKLSSESN